jgi:hypothetical protein
MAKPLKINLAKKKPGMYVPSPLIYVKVWKKLYLKAFMSTRRVRETFFDYEYLRKFEAKIGTET